ncbi:hypothetical protein L5515_015875 [Caenorhabditis briggsae]|uniref:Uncharacterized protein n=1 Tax=Caenorhabditis briggsae TaxID=6238 RepID=A0AAE9EFR3_CAEBR|nr:hypothetical protein L5515_015875 [Caenorhabditis briggsae]
MSVWSFLSALYEGFVSSPPRSKANPARKPPAGPRPGPSNDGFLTKAERRMLEEKQEADAEKMGLPLGRPISWIIKMAEEKHEECCADNIKKKMQTMNVVTELRKHFGGIEASRKRKLASFEEYRAKASALVKRQKLE